MRPQQQWHDDHRSLGLHAFGGATFSSNFVLLRESGYFDVASERKILLHLWSLAIEEQFYLCFPLILWAAWKRRVQPLAVITVVGGASFIWNVVAIGRTSFDFFSPQTRVWELMIGAALASAAMRPSFRLPRAVSRNVASFMGGYLLGFGLLFITKDDPFPGWWALLPTLGTALLISGGASAWINRRLLSNRLLVWFGLISFPLYLWHWPLLAYARLLAGETIAWPYRAALVAVAVGLAWLTYRFIERPLRYGRRVWTIAGLAIPLATLGVIGLSVSLADGFVDTM